MERRRWALGWALVLMLCCAALVGCREDKPTKTEIVYGTVVWLDVGSRYSDGDIRFLRDDGVMQQINFVKFHRDTWVEDVRAEIGVQKRKDGTHLMFVRPTKAGTTKGPGPKPRIADKWDVTVFEYTPGTQLQFDEPGHYRIHITGKGDGK